MADKDKDKDKEREITIERKDHEALLREVKRGIEFTDEAGNLRLTLLALAKEVLPLPANRTLQKRLERTIESCEEVSRMRTELSALARRLQEFDAGLVSERPTPVRPPSRTDIKAAFESSVDYAQGKKKPP